MARPSLGSDRLEPAGDSQTGLVRGGEPLDPIW